MTSALSYVPTTAKIRSCVSLTDKLSMVADLFLLFVCYPFYHRRALRGVPLALYAAMKDYRVKAGETVFMLPGNCPPENTLMASWYEPEVRSVVQGFHEGVFVDAGAGIGLYALTMDRRVEVVALEPDALMCDRLEEAVAANRRANVRVVRAAAWFKPGTLRLHAHPFIRFQSSVKDDSGPAKFSDRSVAVRAVEIDSMVPEGSPLLMKLDVEGAEPEAMVGALKTLLRKDVTVVFEALTPEALARCQRILLPLGYSVSRLDERDYLARRNTFTLPC